MDRLKTPKKSIYLVTIALLLICLSLFVALGYVRRPDDWHTVIESEVWATIVLGTAILVPLGLAARIVMSLERTSRRDVPEAYPGERAFAQAQAAGDLLDIRAAERLSDGMTALPFPVCFMPLPVIASDRRSVESALGNRVGDAPIVLIESDTEEGKTASLSSRLFTFFDANPEAPLALALSGDAVMLVTRRDRVNAWIRPHADTHGNRVRVDQVLSEKVYARHSFLSVAEWQDMIRDAHEEVSGYWHHSPRTFRPGRWRTFRLNHFDGLPLLGYMHRPVPSNLASPPVVALRASYAQAASRMPPFLRPARLFFDHSAHASWSRVVSDALLVRAEHAADFAAQGGVHDMASFGIDAPPTSDLAQIVAAVKAAHDDGVTAATLHRIDDDHAEIVVISSPEVAGRARPATC